MLLSEEIFGNFYEKGKSGGGAFAHEATALARAGVLGATASGATTWERLNARDDQTGEPVGYLAVKRDEFLIKMARRVQKLVSPRYGRRMQFA